MTRKDYELIAKSFRESAPKPEDVKAFSQWKQDITVLGEHLVATHASFSLEMFLSACDVI